MAGTSDSIALATKIHAMFGKRITVENYRELLRKQSVGEIAVYLKQQTNYGDLLHDVNESSVHRGQLENVLRRAIYEDYKRMLVYISPNNRKFYRFFLVRMEINEILSYLRFLNAGRETDYLFSLPSYFAEHSNFDLYGLAKIRSFDELLRLLANTPYADILKNYDPTGGDARDSVQIDNAFEQYYYKYLNHAIENHFAGQDKDKLKRAVGVEIDLQNITTIIRLKKYFNAPAEYIRSLLIPHTVRIKADALNKMVEAPDADAALTVLADTGYAVFFTPGSFEYVEEGSNRSIYDYNKKLLATSTSSAVAMLAYLNLKQLELQNVITIIESVRYGLHPADTEKLLVGVTA